MELLLSTEETQLDWTDQNVSDYGGVGGGGAMLLLTSHMVRSR